MAVKLFVHPAFYRRVRYYRDRIAKRESRPQVARKLATAVEALVLKLAKNPGRGHAAGFQEAELTDILRANVPGFSVFAVFYRWDGQTLSIITLEHTAQHLPSRLADILSRPEAAD
jgi:hypothetical protein